MNLRRWTHPDHPLRLAAAVAGIAFRVRWWWRVRRGKCPLGPPPPCPEPEYVEIFGTYECIDWDNEIRKAAGLEPRYDNPFISEGNDDQETNR